MALINVPDIQNLDAATPELWNTRFGTIVNEMNGNLDAANLKDAAVTASKLATDSVTTGKIADANVTPTKWYNPYKFSAYASANQSLPNATSTKVTLDTELYDTNSNYDPTTNYRYTAPVSGFYSFRGSCGVSNINPGVVVAYLYKNGAAVKTGNLSYGTGGNDVGSVVVGDIQLVSGDYIELYAYQSSGGAKNTQTAGATGSISLAGHLISIT